MAGSTPSSRAWRGRARRAVPLGANIGINKEGAEPERDYPALVAAVAPQADYLVINVSSPEHAGPARPAGRGAA